MKKYSRVSYSVRCQISALLQTNLLIPEISKITGFHKSTIYREIKRNSLGNRYDQKAAQKKRNYRFKNCRREKVFVGKVKSQAIKLIKLYWSPDQIAGRFRFEKKAMVCAETIYKYIRENIELKSYMRFMQKGGNGRLIQRRVAKKRLSIQERPEVINKRSRKGDWERDGMYGANRKQLLICTERKTRYTKIGFIEDYKSRSINDLTMSLLKETKTKILSITNDNGSEFRRDMKEDFPVYFCDPMKPQQRGTVENTIGVLRKQIKRKTELEKLGKKKIKELERKFNLVPRRGLDYKTPYEVFFEKSVALAI